MTYPQSVNPTDDYSFGGLTSSSGRPFDNENVVRLIRQKLDEYDAQLGLIRGNRPPPPALERTSSEEVQNDAEETATLGSDMAEQFIKLKKDNLKYILAHMLSN